MPADREEPDSELPSIQADVVQEARSRQQEEARLERVELRDRKLNRKRITRQKIIVGGTVLAVARRKEEFSTQLLGLLRRYVLDPRDRTALHLDTDPWPWSPEGSAVVEERKGGHEEDDGTELAALIEAGRLSAVEQSSLRSLDRLQAEAAIVLAGLRKLGADLKVPD